SKTPAHLVNFTLFSFQRSIVQAFMLSGSCELQLNLSTHIMLHYLNDNVNNFFKYFSTDLRAASKIRNLACVSFISNE
ncbi:hypothetical protein, partial [Marinilactibacillus psychrotolerans]|uniref:hypothetical protein n=1 Tax=Marinilactibacillus psychrotolerans TaxID=191770 RepID=UPI001D024067